ncbi:MAG: hypothetical protein WAV90_18310, partial [Gordonia amarae]
MQGTHQAHRTVYRCRRVAPQPTAPGSILGGVTLGFVPPLPVFVDSAFDGPFPGFAAVGSPGVPLELNPASPGPLCPSGGTAVGS